MKVHPVAYISSLMGTTMIGSPSESFVEHLLIDSRKLVFAETTLFFAIKTEQGDGHQYIDELYRQGVRSFVVSSAPDLAFFPEASFLLTDNVVGSLQMLAVAHRKQFAFPVIGITGSNGKTIVKEWLNHLLQQQKNIVRSPRSFNSQLGVPLSIWQMQENHELGIFEAGISMPGEMDKLQKMIRPDIGLLTNIGEAHGEGFDSMAEKLAEKLQLFRGSQLLVYCKDHEMVDQAVQQMLLKGGLKGAVSWGTNTGADIVVSHHPTAAGRAFISADYKGCSYRFTIPYIDPAAIENALHCFAVCLHLGLQDQVIPRMNDLPPLSMRLEMKQGQQGSTIINDSYNADLSGLMSALDFVGLQHSSRDRVAILSDVSGIAGDARLAYEKVASYLRLKNIKTLYAVGGQFNEHASCFGNPSMKVFYFRDTEALLHHLHGVNFRDQVVLVKGARSFHFERVSHLLENKNHQTRLEIDLSSVAQNLHLFKAGLKPATRIMAMVKAFSYGAGSYEIASLLQFHHVDYIAVAYVDEGVELRKAGIRMPIMVMNTAPSSFSSLVEYNLEPEIYSLRFAQELNAYLQQEGISYFPVHLKLDTGMHRLGLEPADIGLFIDQVGRSSILRVKTVFTHLVASENPLHDDFTATQLQRFDHGCKLLSEQLGYGFIRHAANTAAIRRHPSAEYEMVRIGIGLYGIDPGKADLTLQEAVALKTTIAQIKDVEKGESVGYGRHSIVENKTRVATIRIGYADGFPRSLGNGNGTVLVRGKFFKTIGNVCMDMTMIDVTADSSITIEDEVLVFGKEHSVVAVAKDAGTIPYEIMTGISQRVPRIYLGE
jgi:alanine racemase